MSNLEESQEKAKANYNHLRDPPKKLTSAKERVPTREKTTHMFGQGLKVTK